MLLNLPRAYEVMDKHGLDGLVATLPVNVYYLTDYFSFVMRMARPYSHFAVLPRREDMKPVLITSSKEMNNLAVIPTTARVIVYSYRVKPNLQEFDPVTEEPLAEDWLNWPVRGGSELTEISKKWLTLSREQAGHYVA